MEKDKLINKVQGAKFLLPKTVHCSKSKQNKQNNEKYCSCGHPNNTTLK